MYGKIQESELTEIIPFIYTSAIWGQYHVFHILSSSELPIESGYYLIRVRSQ